jgi:HlyD family secretion protein
MKPQDLTQHDDEESALPWIGEPASQAAGPQGAALILELQRLRQAFDEGDPRPAQARQPSRDRVRPPQDRSHSTGPRRPRQPKRKRKSTIGRAIDACLEQFGLNTPAPVAPGGTRRREPEIELTPRQPRSVTLDARPRNGMSPSRQPAKDGPYRAPAPLNRAPAEIQNSRAQFKRPSPPPSARTPGPRANLPALASRVEPETAMGRLIGRSRESLVAGVSFLVERDALADLADNDNVPGESLASRTGRAFQNELRRGLRVLIVATVLGGGWLTLVPLAGAVVAQGTLVVQSNLKSIQHPTGGVVAEIAVHNGMRVNAGDLLLRLDATQAQANLQTVSKQLDEARVRIARLVAERDGLPEPVVPVEMASRLDDSAVKALMATEESLFKARANAHRSQKDLLESRVAQLGQEISGLDSQVESKGKELDLISSELSGVQELYDKRLVPLTRLTTLQRDRARIEGERGQLVSTIAETKSKIGEAQLNLVKLEQDFRTDVVKELSETQGKESELVQKAVSAQDVIDRIELRAPTSGVIHQLAAHTIGGVIRAGDTIVEIVPDSDDLQIEAKLDPKDIDQVRTGQKAFVRFSALNARVTPQVAALVSFISADTTKDQVGTQQPFYTVRLTLPEEERHRLDGEQLVSGMQAEVFMQTGSRTMLSYLFRPIMEQLGRAFVER